jgi:hypothetical protein
MDLIGKVHAAAHISVMCRVADIRPAQNIDQTLLIESFDWLEPAQTCHELWFELVPLCWQQQFQQRLQ